MTLTRTPAQLAASSAFWQLVRTPEFPDLGQGPRSRRLGLASLSAGLDRLAHQFAWDAPMEERLRAAALLYHDHHNEAHDLVQDHVDSDGALIHAVLHRREPDYWNAKYWFRRVGDHPVYHRVTEWLDNPGSAPFSVGGEWDADVGRSIRTRLTLGGWVDPLALVDQCEELASRGSDDGSADLLRWVQHAEFEALVEHLLA